MNTPINDWVKIELPVCDCCTKVAVWKHPEGGLRCDKCQRPTTSQKPRTLIATSLRR